MQQPKVGGGLTRVGHVLGHAKLPGQLLNLSTHNKCQDIV